LREEKRREGSPERIAPGGFGKKGEGKSPTTNNEGEGGKKKKGGEKPILRKILGIAKTRSQGF